MTSGELKTASLFHEQENLPLAAYVRGTAESTGRQKDAIEHYCLTHYARSATFFCDQVVSGLAEARSGWIALRHHILSYSNSIVLADTADRISRNLSEYLRERDELHAAGAMLKVVSGPDIHGAAVEIEYRALMATIEERRSNHPAFGRRNSLSG